jgi:hypothetical protein
MEWVVTILQQYGLQGVVMGVLGYSVYYLVDSSVSINKDRLGEREILIRALDSNTNAVRDNAAATNDRNQVTKDLAQATEKQAVVLEMFIQKIQFQQDILREKLQDQKVVIDSLALANRVNSAAIQDFMSSQRESIDQIKRNDKHLKEIDESIRRLAPPPHTREV